LFFIAAIAATICLPKIAAAESGQYQAVVLPANIAPTAATTYKGKVEVVGQPRISKGHPCTLWDQEDVNQLKKQLATSEPLQKELARLKAAMDTRISQPLGVPEPGKNEATKEGRRAHAANSSVIAELGTVYALTGDPKYAEYCRQMLVAYAKGYRTYQHPEGWTKRSYRSAFDGRLTGQFLEDGFWLVRVAFGYDLVYNLPSFTDAERKLIRTDLLEAVAEEFYDPILHGSPAERDYVSSPNNRAAVCASGVLMAGYASENAELVNIALYGKDGTKENPKGGVFGTHFTPDCILPDGLWVEGAPGYQLGIASSGLLNDAETLWHHGIDLYRHDNGALKKLLDSAPGLAYPDPKMTVAALHDSGTMGLVDDRAWLNNEIGVPYECGYRRYRDARYLPIVRNATQSLSLTVHAGPPSLFLDIPSEESAPPRPVEHANFFSVGYGVLRLPTETGGNQLILEYGPNAGHAHPSKLGIDLYALGDSLISFPGVIFPYNDPMDPKWYWTTLSNCALTIDEKSQIYSGNRWKFPKTLPEPMAQQLVFGPASTMGIQKAWSNTVYPGVNQDRALFMTPQYLADIFGAFSDGPHLYDLAWHFRGELVPSLKLASMQFPDPAVNGYNAFDEVSHANSNQAWSATVTTPKGHTVRLLAPAGTDTEVILGNGHLITKKEQKLPPTIIERRAKQNAALFGNVVDLSGTKEGYIKSVTQTGGLEVGYGLLSVQTAKGTDLCFAAYRPGNYKAGALETDAQQAFVLMDGKNVQAMYLGGGKTLKTTGGAITRSEPGLAYLEKTGIGSYLVANPSPTDATLTVTLSALQQMKAFNLDDKGQRAGAASVKSAAPSAFVIQLKADSKVEFVLK